MWFLYLQTIENILSLRGIFFLLLAIKRKELRLVNVVSNLIFMNII